MRRVRATQARRSVGESASIASRSSVASCRVRCITTSRAPPPSASILMAGSSQPPRRRAPCPASGDDDPGLASVAPRSSPLHRAAVEGGTGGQPRIRWVVSPVRSSVRRLPRMRWVVSPVRSSVSRWDMTLSPSVIDRPMGPLAPSSVHGPPDNQARSGKRRSRDGTAIRRSGTGDATATEVVR